MAAAVALDRTIADVHDVGDAARSASGVLQRPRPPVRRRTRRCSKSSGVRCSRVSTSSAWSRTSFVTSERHALVAALREERLALVAALRQERIEAIAGIDAIKTRAIEASLAGLKDLVDYAFWRVAAAADESACASPRCSVRSRCGSPCVALA